MHVHGFVIHPVACGGQTETSGKKLCCGSVGVPLTPGGSSIEGSYWILQWFEWIIFPVWFVHLSCNSKSWVFLFIHFLFGMSDFCCWSSAFFTLKSLCHLIPSSYAELFLHCPGFLCAPCLSSGVEWAQGNKQWSWLWAVASAGTLGWTPTGFSLPEHSQILRKGSGYCFELTHSTNLNHAPIDPKTQLCVHLSSSASSFHLSPKEIRTMCHGGPSLLHIYLTTSL